jgi:hypothetical protein
MSDEAGWFWASGVKWIATMQDRIWAHAQRTLALACSVLVLLRLGSGLRVAHLPWAHVVCWPWAPCFAWYLSTCGHGQRSPGNDLSHRGKNHLTLKSQNNRECSHVEAEVKGKVEHWPHLYLKNLKCFISHGLFYINLDLKCFCIE